MLLEKRETISALIGSQVEKPGPRIKIGRLKHEVLYWSIVGRALCNNASGFFLIGPFLPAF